MTTTTVPRLRPLSLAELLDQSIRLYRRNFLPFIGIIAVVQIPITLLQLIPSLLTLSSMIPHLQESNGRPPDPFEIFSPAYFAGIAGSLAVGLIGFVLIRGVATAALTQAVAESYLGQSLGIIEAYRKIGRSWLSLLGALLLAMLLGIALFIWLLIPCVGWLTGIGMLAFFSLIIVPLIAPVIVLEKQPAAVAIRRAWDLARRRFWWVLGFVFTLFIFGQLVITGPVTLVGFIFQAISGGPLNYSMTEAIIQTVVQSLLQLMFSLIYLPLQITAITLMYFDLRIRTEGFDLVLLSAGAGEDQTEMTEIAAQVPQPAQGNWFTMNEMGYFILVSFGGAVIYFILFSLFGALAYALMSASGNPRGF